jgi:hypothetical protein
MIVHRLRALHAAIIRTLYRLIAAICLAALMLIPGSASAQTYLYDRDGNLSGNIIGQPGGVQSYYGTDGTIGNLYTPGPQGGIGSYQFSRPNGSIQSGTFWQAPTYPPPDHDLMPAPYPPFREPNLPTFGGPTDRSPRSRWGR